MSSGNERRLLASHPDYEEMELLLRDLGIALNPGCWFGTPEMPDPERRATVKLILMRLGKLLDGGIWRDLIEELPPLVVA